MSNDVRGMIAVDKIGCKILFLNPQSYATEAALEGFQRTVHELLVVPETGRAYVPIFGDGIHGRNPNPGHQLWVIDLLNRKIAADIDLRPLSAPHTVRLGPDGLIYITCEQRESRGDRPQHQHGDRRNRFRLEQRPPALHRQ